MTDWNPDTVVRVDTTDDVWDSDPNGRFVLWEDYDRLLALCNEAQAKLNNYQDVFNAGTAAREKLQKLLPSTYWGWNYLDAAADYIEKLTRPENGQS